MNSILASDSFECEMKSGFSIQQVKIVEKDKMDEIKEAIYKIEEDLDSDDSDLEKETKVLKERTKHSIRLMKNEFMKKVQFPYLVRALSWVQTKFLLRRFDHTVWTTALALSGVFLSALSRSRYFLFQKLWLENPRL